MPESVATSYWLGDDDERNNQLHDGLTGQLSGSNLAGAFLAGTLIGVNITFLVIPVVGPDNGFYEAVTYHVFFIQFNMCNTIYISQYPGRFA